MAFPEKQCKLFSEEPQLWPLHGVRAEKRPGAGADAALYVCICKTYKQTTSLYHHYNKYLKKTKKNSTDKSYVKRINMVSSIFATGKVKFNT